MARVFLVRHGTHDLVGKVLAGRMPGVGLSAAGRAQAAALAAHFAGTAVGSILSSPMQRCRETAAPIAARLALPVGESEDLTELDCGAWTGKSFDALASDPRWHAWNGERAHAVIPDGESAGAVLTRVMALLGRVSLEDGPPAILVTHSDVIKGAMLGLLGASPDLHDRFEVEPASITTLDLWPGGGKIVRSNQAVAS